MSNTDKWCPIKLYKTFPGLLKNSKACENTSFNFISFLQNVFNLILKVNLSSHHYAQYFLLKRISLFPLRHISAEVSKLKQTLEMTWLMFS